MTLSVRLIAIGTAYGLSALPVLADWVQVVLDPVAL